MKSTATPAAGKSITAPKFSILADAVCVNCQRRIGWHDQYYGCPAFTAEDPARLREQYDAWFAENEPSVGFRDDDDLPHYVLVARGALGRAECGL